MVGDWDGDGRDTLGVRRGAQYHLKDVIAPGPADRVVVYGRAGDTTLVGDWDGDGVDTLGVRRDPVPLAVEGLRGSGGLTSTEIPTAASGRLTTVAGAVPAPRSAAREVTVRVQVEAGLPVDGATFADVAMDTLNDRRGWGADGSVSFARGTTGQMTLVLASPATVDRLCAPLRTNGYTSCRTGSQVIINAARWAGGATAFNAAGGDIAAYRQYVVNHETGHFLGHGHVGCPGAGRLAPVMQQQTLSMGGCRPNGWPHP
ncbi:DUF3152 domain-containing protein [Georgenia subflava]|uniref:DUF3152 domain-containing protein n=1 Tax=Georgenia subflava TaxID=1622177 RepID=A0A6N7EQY3_9MICO|nr:DUF3152 domain-containing protein [Georgenia subflava]